MVEKAVEDGGGDGAVAVDEAGHCLKALLVVSTMGPRS